MTAIRPCVIVILAVAPAALAQTSRPAPATAPSAVPVVIQTVIVTAEKQEQPLQDVPGSITVLGAGEIHDAGIRDLRDTPLYAPNVLFSQFTAVRETFPFIRGIGSGQNSPAVTTYYDGVPQLSFATANQELYDIDRIEFLRGPQSTLYGRNSEGGVINVYSRRPSNDFRADADVTFGDYALEDYRAAVSGPIVKNNLFFSFSGGFDEREGYSVNNPDGDRLDGRNHLFGRAQLLWTPTDQLDVRFILSAERDHDGDFPLFDLGSIRQNPGQVSHDFEGYAHRDVDEAAVTVTNHGDSADFTSVSAYQMWKSDEDTDLDETAEPWLLRDDTESEYDLIQEFHLSNAAGRPLELSPQVKLKWLLGLFAFRQADEQFIANPIEPAGAPIVGAPFPYTAFTNAAILNYGVGIFGDTTFTLAEKLDLTIGMRYDWEHAGGNIDNFNSSIFIPGSVAKGGQRYGQFSPRFAAGYHWTPDFMTYASASDGYKVGGFNATAPTGKTEFGPEHSWTYELGAKTDWLDRRLTFNADVFYIDWSDMQLDVPTAEPSVYYIDNVGRSTSEGAEAELTWHALKDWDIFGGIGYSDARFSQYTQPGGASAHDNHLPFAPTVTWNAGSQYTLKLQHDLRSWVRAEVFGVGRYYYDASNAQSQGSYVLTNFRVGFGAAHWRLEGFVDNAFDTRYVPIAYPFPLAASGYVGETGTPRTFGVRLGLTF